MLYLISLLLRKTLTLFIYGENFYPLINISILLNYTPLPRDYLSLFDIRFLVYSRHFVKQANRNIDELFNLILSSDTQPKLFY